jgi:hypothetical protein
MPPLTGRAKINDCGVALKKIVKKALQRSNPAPSADARDPESNAVDPFSPRRRMTKASDPRQFFSK